MVVTPREVDILAVDVGEVVRGSWYLLSFHHHHHLTGPVNVTFPKITTSAALCTHNSRPEVCLWSLLAKWLVGVSLATTTTTQCNFPSSFSPFLFRGSGDKF